jgi:hypothetical protein
MGGVVSSIGGAIFGSSSSPGALGTGRYQAQAYNIDKSAFNPNNLTSYQQEQKARATQSDFIRQLQAQMRGEGPSLSNLQLQQATDRNIAQQMGQAASQRGVNPALAARMAMGNIAGLNQQAAQDAAIIRQQEMLNAQQQLGGAISGQRQGDLAATDRDLGAKMGKEQLEVQQRTGLNNVNSQAYSDAAKRRGDFISGIGQGIASAGLFYEGGVVPSPVKKDLDQEKVSAFVASFKKAMKEKPDTEKPKDDEDDKEMPKLFGLFNEGGEVPEPTKTKSTMQKFVEGVARATGETESEGQARGHQGAGKSVGKGLGALINAMKSKPKGVGDANINPAVPMTANEGGEVPGRAVTKGDSPKNDFVLALLSPGEIVIPRTKATSKEKAKKFVDVILDKKYKGGKVC